MQQNTEDALLAEFAAKKIVKFQQCLNKAVVCSKNYNVCRDKFNGRYTKWFNDPLSLLKTCHYIDYLL